MKSWMWAFLAVSGLGVSGQAWAVQVGTSAPEFTAVASDGKSYKLADFKGKYVVLEWHNQGCPYVKKHYESGNMQKLQKQFRDKGFVWFTVISSAAGKQGHVNADGANAYIQKMKAGPTAVLLDDTGTVGKLYGAKVTPHMFLINPKGTLIYNGAIDDNDSSDADDIPTSKNYLAAAAEEALAGKAVSTPTSRPYGCSVKY